MEITQAIEILKGIMTFEDVLDCLIERQKGLSSEVLAVSISILESFQQAGNELGEGQHKCELCGQPVNIYSGEEGTNSYDGLAIPIIAKKNLEIEELENQRNDFARDAYNYEEQIKELKNTSETSKKMLREFKEKCSGEEIK